MSEAHPVDDLGRLSFRTAGQLRLLAERLTTLDWQPDGYTPADLARLADALGGMALRCALDTGNTALLSELTGRHVRDLTDDDHP
ncbi:hypothetical protein GCM10012275_63970 [Longimycelium tulufanense]|uniref:Uncharacterized protein n=1 Tax=Longimycelium tulufanense TaxID=907463 RepID=A0A8J3CKP0_9PSEU|nr:hypothetical protein [Longimycelium tulufanense]GGM84464.1 hypothetical protein GCM10012275_63970 [Longimycelium tulufanense]